MLIFQQQMIISFIKVLEQSAGQHLHHPREATDLRAGACLVIAALMAKGRTEITNVEFILRGYSNIIEKLRNLGADIELIED